MGKKFIVADLDGTLLDTTEYLSQQYVSQLNQLIEEGLDFTIATGRDLKKTKEALPGLNIKYPVILTNGALLGDLTTGKYLKVTSILPSIVEQILTFSVAMNIAPIVFASFDHQGEKIYYNKGTWGPKTGIHPLTPEQFIPFKNNDVISIQFHTMKAQLDPLKAKIEESFGDEVLIIYIEDVAYNNSNVDGEWYWLEIDSKTAGKEKMLQALIHEMKRDMKDVIAFGDNHNDLEMLKIAGIGITLENGIDELKEIADEIIPSNQEGGVINYLVQHKKELI